MRKNNDNIAINNFNKIVIKNSNNNENEINLNKI